MNLNATLLGEVITFALLVIFTMKFVWPPISNMLDNRASKIAEGLAASEKGKQELLNAEEKIAWEMKKIQVRSVEIIANSEKRANQIIEEAKERALIESEQILNNARAKIEQDFMRMKEELRHQVSNLVIRGVTQVLKTEINESVHEHALSQLKAEL